MFQWLNDYLRNLYGLDRLDTPQGILNLVCMIINTIFMILVAYRFVYILLGFFVRPKPYPAAPKTKKYAYIVAARNEEKVIGNLLKSIKEQDYPADLISVFVVADNCSKTDRTAAIAREMDAIVYERHDESKQRKGWALGYLFSAIEKDFGIHHYDGFFIMDADNVLSRDFTSKMNDAFSTGKYLFVQGYRNSKNFKTNVVSSSTSIANYRGMLSCHRPREILGTGTNLMGTGYLVASSVLKDGWTYFSISEDWELTIDYLNQDHQVGYCDEAVFFDEQPESVRISFRQRLRWSKGVLINYAKHGGAMFLSFLKHPTWSKYDIFWDIFPYGLINFILGLVYQIFSLVLLLSDGQSYSWASFGNYVFSTTMGIVVGCWIVGIFTCVRERKNIHCPFYLEAFYIFMWPLFDLFSMPISLGSLFVSQKWKTIPHRDQSTMEDFEKKVS